ncbi:MAG TPA: serine/threonine-protein kinase [Polyangia bacterium]
MIGRTVGNYVIQEKIGEGGMGAVYLAVHPKIQRQVAIKVLLPEYSKNPQMVARFFTEAKSANEIKNEHIVDIIDFGELEGGANYIIMEWLDGRSLSSAMMDGAFPVGRAIHITRGIGRALAAAHARGIVHRDLKPDNIFLVKRQSDPDFVKVLDFGIAKLMQAQASSPDVKTKTGALIGTPTYMSPEQCRGAPVDHRTDIYALGVIVYQMLTGRLPFLAEGLGDLLLQHMTQAPQPLRELQPSIPAAVEQAVLWALAKDPDKRPQHVQELLDALDGVSTGVHAAMQVATLPGKSLAPTDTLARAAGEKVQRPAGRGTVLVGALSAAVLVTAGAWVALHGRASSPVPAAPAPVSAPVKAPPAVAPAAPAPKPASVTPAPAAPATAHITIVIEPPGASVRLDDAPLKNPFEGDFPRGDARHHLVASAPGYRSEARWVSFDADRAIALTLHRGSGTHEESARRPQAAKEPEPAAKPAKLGTDGKPVYKGTKGSLITDNPYK